MHGGEGDFCPQRAVLHNGGGHSCRIVFLLWFGRRISELLGLPNKQVN